MKVKFIEATQDAKRGFNWGKFFLMQFDNEWEYQSQIDVGRPLLRAIGWSPNQIWVLDLQTCEGVAIDPSGCAAADLHRHKVLVCPMFEPFLEWLYRQDLTDLNKLPSLVEMPDAEAADAGYRRAGERAKTAKKTGA